MRPATAGRANQLSVKMSFPTGMELYGVLKGPKRDYLLLCNDADVQRDVGHFQKQWKAAEKKGGTPCPVQVRVACMIEFARECGISDEKILSEVTLQLNGKWELIFSIFFLSCETDLMIIHTKPSVQKSPLGACNFPITGEVQPTPLPIFLRSLLQVMIRMIPSLQASVLPAKQAPPASVLQATPAN